MRTVTCTTTFVPQSSRKSWFAKLFEATTYEVEHDHGTSIRLNESGMSVYVSNEELAEHFELITFERHTDE